MLAVRREGVGGNGSLGDRPVRQRVSLLVERAHRLAHAKEAHQRRAAAVGVAVGVSGGQPAGAVGHVSGEEGRVVLLAVVHDQAAVVVGGQEQGVGARQPLDLHHRVRIDCALPAVSKFLASSTRSGGKLATFLLRRAYLLEIGSNQMMSPVEKPMMTSSWLALRVSMLTSWQIGCALVKRILDSGSCCSLREHSTAATTTATPPALAATTTTTATTTATYLDGRIQVEPAEGAVDVGERHQVFGAALGQALGQRLVCDDARDEGRVALGDVGLGPLALVVVLATGNGCQRGVAVAKLLGHVVRMGCIDAAAAAAALGAQGRAAIGGVGREPRIEAVVRGGVPAAGGHGRVAVEVGGEGQQLRLGGGGGGGRAGLDLH